MTTMDVYPATPSGAVLSPCRTYRYALHRRWDFDEVPPAQADLYSTPKYATPPRPPAVFVMLNPSTADATEDDATIRRCVRFAQMWGRGGLVVVNLYAYRATNPKDLLGKKVYCDGASSGGPPDGIVGPENAVALSSSFGLVTDYVVAAWGAFAAPDIASRIQDVVVLASAMKVELRVLRLTDSGQPHHPLRLPNACRPVPWTPLAQRQVL